ncbi:MAG: type II/IV secretion system ATPase subunit [Candidatus Thermoplasmatota archaeon]|nr:type II/IV secretion system ATPase subunit [Candidatus Thermoplasmatota archaeon]
MGDAETGLEVAPETTLGVAPGADGNAGQQAEEKVKMAPKDMLAGFVLSLKKPKNIRIKAPKAKPEDSHAGEPITPIPKISEKHINEIEVMDVEPPYSYVRVVYDTISNDYFYEAQEPPLTDDERDLVAVIKEAIIDGMEKTDVEDLKEKKILLRNAIENLLKDLGLGMDPISKERVIYYLLRDFTGYGPIQVGMTDTEVEDISCDGVGVPIFIYHRKYGSIPSNIKFETEHELDSFVVWIAQRCGKHISVAEPMLDATMPDGSRLQATLGTHVTKRGSSFTIRRFKENPFTPLDMIRFKTMSIEMMAYLWISIENGQSMLVCGGTASGKTTTLNAILLFIPPQMKIVSIEDTRELNLPHDNWIPSLTRSGFGAKNLITGKAPGEVDMFDLLTAALRQRPQYIMVGEVRGAEAYTVFQAMATGKTAYSTFHADDVQAMIHRMESDPINLPRALITALNLVLLQAQVKVGTKMTRRVKGLHEIVSLDPMTNEIITNSAYTWNPADDTFNYSGHSYVYDYVMESKNWTQRQMEKEIQRRIKILTYLRKKGSKSHREVAKIIASYYDNPDAVMEDVDRGMEELERQERENLGI